MIEKENKEIKNSNLLSDNTEYEKVSYDAFKTEIDRFEGKNNKIHVDKNTENLKNKEKKENVDINSLMNKLDFDLNNIRN